MGTVFFFCESPLGSVLYSRRCDCTARAGALGAEGPQGLLARHFDGAQWGDQTSGAGSSTMAMGDRNPRQEECSLGQCLLDGDYDLNVINS